MRIRAVLTRYMGYVLNNYPLADKLRAFYEKEIGDYGAFIGWEARLLLQMENYMRMPGTFYKAIFGRMPFEPGASGSMLCKSDQEYSPELPL